MRYDPEKLQQLIGLAAKAAAIVREEVSVAMEDGQREARWPAGTLLWDDAECWW